MPFDLTTARPTIKTGFDLSSAKPMQDTRSDFMELVSPTERVLAGAGKAFMDIGRGAGQRLGLVSQEAIDEAKRLDWPLMQTGTGITGNVIGNVAAALPTMAIPGAGTALGSAAVGAGLGALQPTATGESALVNAALGGAFGAGGALIPRGMARIVNPKATQTIKQSVGQLTPGQALGGVFKATEEKMTSLPLAGNLVRKAQRQSIESFDKGVLNKVLAPIGEKATAIGHEGIAEAGEKISKAYATLLPKLNIQADNVFQQQLAGVKALASALPDDKIAQLDRILSQKVLGKFTQYGKMSGDTMKQVDSELGRLIRGYKGSANFDERQLGDALRETQSALRSMVQRANPEQAANLGKINDAYAQFLRVERAASGLGAKEGVFTPAQLLNAVKATDSSLRKRAFSRGEAMLQDVAQQGEKTIGGMYPDSGTAGRALAALGAGGAYMYNPALALGEGAVAATYGIPAIRNALVAAIGKRPEIAPEVANYLRLASPAAGRIGAIGGAAYLGQQ